MDNLILAILIGLALAAVRMRDLLGATAVLGAYSLLMALLWCRMNAVDVAFTEAAVGAGVSTVLGLVAISRVGRHEARAPLRIGGTRPFRAMGPVIQVGALLVCLLTAAALLYGATDMPRVGDPEAPPYVHADVAARYIHRSPDRPGRPGEVGPPNMVTSVLGDYRGYDTLGETVVIFAGALCVVLLLRQAGTGGRRASRRGL